MTTPSDVFEHLAAQTEALAADRRYPEPQLDVIIDMATREFERFDKFHSNCVKADEFYRGEINIPVTEGGNVVIVPIAHTSIETFADHIDTDHLQIDVRSGPRGQAAAEIRAKFFAGLLLHSEQDKMLLYTASKHIALYGVALITRFHDADRWPLRPETPKVDAPDSEWTDFANKLADFSERRKIEYPIVDDIINPKQAVWDLSRGEKRWVIEKFMMAPEDLMKWFPDFGIRGEGDVEILKYTDDQWVAYIADKNWLMAPRWHGYQVLPYAVIEPAMGVDSMDAPPEERYVGLITPSLQNLILELSRLVSQYDTIVRTNAWPIIYFEGPPELVAWAKDNWDTNPGAKNVLPQGVTLNQIIPTTTFQQILDVHRLIREYIDEDTLPRVVRGVEPQNRSSGFEVTARAGMARLKLKAAAKALATGVQRLNMIGAKILEHVIREPITVFAQTPSGLVEQRVRPRDVAGQYNSKVTLEAASPEDRINRGMFGQKLFEGGLASELMTRRDFLGQTNALEDMMQTKAEQLWKSPEFQMIMLQMAGDAFTTFIGQQQSLAGSLGITPSGGNSGQFGPGQMASFATTSFPDQAGRSRAIIEARRPGSLQDIDRTMSQFGKIGAGPMRTGGGRTILPGGGVR